MAVSLSVKNVPESLAAALRRRAKQHHRSLQGELLAILHDAIASGGGRPVDSRTDAARETAAATWTPLTPDDIVPRSESALIVRAMRDGRTRTIGELFDALAAMGTGTPAESATIIRRSRSSR